MNADQLKTFIEMSPCMIGLKTFVKFKSWQYDPKSIKEIHIDEPTNLTEFQYTLQAITFCNIFNLTVTIQTKELIFQIKDGIPISVQRRFCEQKTIVYYFEERKGEVYVGYYFRWQDSFESGLKIPPIILPRKDLKDFKFSFTDYLIEIEYDKQKRLKEMFYAESYYGSWKIKVTYTKENRIKSMKFTGEDPKLYIRKDNPYTIITTEEK